MHRSFLLRFQEDCQSGDRTLDVSCGTQTGTKIMHEQPDRDPGSEHSDALPRMNSGGTQTRVARETSDRIVDDGLHAIRTRLVSGSTRTATYVRAEAEDDDHRRWNSLRALPRASQANCLATRTRTGVPQESGD